MSRGLRAKQVDGRKTTSHIITAIVSIALSLGVTYFAHLGKAGPAGPAGKSATSVSSGVCWYFGPDSHGHTRFQVFTPNADGTCTTGHFVSTALPGR